MNRYYIYVTRGGDTREFLWEADNEQQARQVVAFWNERRAQYDELYFMEQCKDDY